MAERRTFTSIEQRVLAYLDQQGPTHRTTIVCDLASPNSRIGRLGGTHNGSNGATPLIMAAWCKSLLRDGLVREVRETRGRWANAYRHHEITDLGREAVRMLAAA